MGRSTLADAFRWVRAHQSLVVVLLCFAAVGYSYYVGQRADGRIRSSQSNGRAQLCHAIDGDHNRERARLIAGEKLLYAIPSFKVLVSTPDAERAAYDKARHDYYEVRKTRPPFCDFVPNPVKPFPSLKEFRHPRDRAYPAAR